MNAEVRMHRVRRLLLNPSKILSLFTKPNSDHDCHSHVVFTNLPDDYTIVGAPYYDPCWHAIVFLIEHPSFDEVALGEIPPVHDEHVGMRYEYTPELKLVSTYNA